MKKKIILILSIMAIAICVFALAVSASDYYVEMNGSFSSSHSSSVSGNYYNVHCYVSDTEDYFESTLGYDFGIVEIYLYDSEIRNILLVNIENWHRFFTEKNITTLEEFNDYIPIAVEKNEFPNESLCSFIPYLELYDEHIWNGYCAYVEEINQPTYEDGLAEGAAEYKKSYEYLSSLDLARTEGRSEGKMEFVKSKEYANALSNEYDRGLQDGLNENSGMEITDIVGMLLSLAMFLIPVFVLWRIFGKRKKNRKVK